MPRCPTTAHQRIAAEIRYTHLVFAFISGKTPPWDPPIAGDFGVTDERASEIIGWALICDLDDLLLARTYGHVLPRHSGVFLTSARN